LSGTPSIDDKLPETFLRIRARPQGYDKQDSASPGILDANNILLGPTAIGEKSPDRRYNDRGKPKQITLRDDRGCLRIVCPIFFGGHMPKTYLFLVVQPFLVMRLKTNVGDPLHKAKPN
jgi:hypothetical protein